VSNSLVYQIDRFGKRSYGNKSLPSTFSACRIDIFIIESVIIVHLLFLSHFYIETKKAREKQSKYQQPLVITIAAIR
jgi:hypothetical protein